MICGGHQAVVARRVVKFPGDKQAARDDHNTRATITSPRRPTIIHTTTFAFFG